MAQKTYLDVNVFVYWLNDTPDFGETATHWIKQIDKQSHDYMTSSLTLYETTIILAGLTNKTLKDKSLIQGITNAFSQLSNLKIIPLTQQQIIEAPLLMEQYKLDFENALHLTSAMDNDASIIISNDKDFDKTPLARMF